MLSTPCYTMVGEGMVTSPAGEIPAPEEDFLTSTATICSFSCCIMLSAVFEMGRKRKGRVVFRELQLSSPVSLHSTDTVTQPGTVWPCPCPAIVPVWWQAAADRDREVAGTSSSRHPGQQGISTQPGHHVWLPGRLETRGTPHTTFPSMFRGIHLLTIHQSST